MKEKELEERFIELIERYKQMIYKVCLIYASDDDVLNDLYQEVLINLWKAFPRFRNECKESTWLYRVALNTCITYIRKESTRIPTIPLTIDMEAILDEQDEHGRLIKKMYQMIARLEKPERAILMLWLEDKSYEEIADVMNISKANVGTRLMRIREKLRNMSNF
jgi:RNA polymerase sigma-70 factor (ECF subfamily)